MTATPRILLPELLDELSPSDPRARRARRDLRQVHRAMGSLTILKRAIKRLRLRKPPRRILELGAGDGSLMLRLSQALTPPWRDVELTLLDRHDLLTTETRQGYEELGWRVTVMQRDVLEWAAAEYRTDSFDMCITCLFLHHFDACDLAVVMRAVARQANAFIALEPRRNILARVGSRLVGLLGTNQVTRQDAVTSVAAGFTGHELTEYWPASPEWTRAEYAALPFTHCFSADRTRARSE